MQRGGTQQRQGRRSSITATAAATYAEVSHINSGGRSIAAGEATAK